MTTFKTQSNRAAGNRVEHELCEALFHNGFWVHNLKQDNAGQPADIIAAKDGQAFLIDCKNCARQGFDLRRIESNQITAMQLWQECGNGYGWFALKLDGKFYMLPFLRVKNFGQTRRSLSADEIRSRCLPFEKWVEVIV